MNPGYIQTEIDCAAFHKAVSDGHIEQLKWFLDNRIDINHMGLRRMSALHYAVEAGRIPVVEFLLANEASPSMRSQDGETPLFAAVCQARNGRNAHIIVNLLLAAGADVNARSHSCVTPLMYAVANVHSQDAIAGPANDVATASGTLMVKTILEAIESSPAEKSTLDDVRNTGFGAIHMAISSRDVNVLGMLLVAGVDHTYSVRDRPTALELARRFEQGIGPMAKLLIDVEDEVQYKLNQRVFALGNSRASRNSSIIRTLTPGLMTVMFSREACQKCMLSDYEKLVDAITLKRLKNILEMERRGH
jgi:ankyrin repeat protein